MRFAGNVQWAANDDSVLDCAKGVVLALRPMDQEEWIPLCLTRSNLGRLLLEKPLAHSPEDAAVVFDELIGSRKVFRIGYTFRYTAWGKQILNVLGKTKKSGLLSIRWAFLAHHFRHDLRNWKRFNTTGGGAIRFYGIHIIALLAEVGYRYVTLSRAFGSSPDEIEKWIAIFAGTGLPECEVLIDTRSTVSNFQIDHSPNPNVGQVTTIFAKSSDPFDTESKAFPLGQIDQRVPILIQLCHSLWQETATEYEWYDATINLWLSIERITQLESVRILE